MSTGLSRSFAYDAIGNMVAKSDVGNYGYPPSGYGQPRPHAVTSVSGGTINATFYYDSNGNQVYGSGSSFGRSIAWTSYNKPASISQGSRTISFLHDTNHQRFKQVTPEGTTVYIAAFGVVAELLVSPNPQWREYLSVGNVAVGVRLHNINAETVATRYFHTDHMERVQQKWEPVLRPNALHFYKRARFPGG